MNLLNKPQALDYVRERLDLFNRGETSNPFAGASWTLHFIEQVAEDSWTFVTPEDRAGGLSLMLLYTGTGDVVPAVRRDQLLRFTQFTPHQLDRCSGRARAGTRQAGGATARFTAKVSGDVLVDARP